MTLLRQHLRILVACWIALQAVSLSAFVPRDCCAGHREPATTEKPCHEDAAAMQCPLRGADAQQCPMHHGQDQGKPAAAGHHAGPAAPHGDHTAAPAEPPTNDPCSMRGLCKGPMEALFAVLATQGVMPETIALLPYVPVSPAPPLTREHLLSRLATPDSPPPRA